MRNLPVVAVVVASIMMISATSALCWQKALNPRCPDPLAHEMDADRVSRSWGGGCPE